MVCKFSTYPKKYSQVFFKASLMDRRDPLPPFYFSWIKIQGRKLKYGQKYHLQVFT